MQQIICPVYSNALRHPHAPAIVTKNFSLSYRELHTIINAVVARLKTIRVKAGTKVLIRSSNTLENVILLFSLWRLGAVACPVSTRYPPRLIHNARIKVNAKVHFLTDKAVQKVVADPRGPSPDNSGLRPQKISLNAPATIIFTSGSTGDPKAVCHSYANHYYSALGSNKILPLKTGDRWLLSLPLYHVGGIAILFRSIISGSAIIIPDLKRNLAELIFDLKATHISLVPTQLYRLIANKANLAKLNNLKCILLGGSMIPTALEKQTKRLGLPVLKTYGLSEMASQVVTANQKLLYCQLKLSLDGEILVKGKTLFKGYVSKNHIHRPLKSGWFKTGDLGEFTKSGRLKVVGRKDNMFISGGENIYPEEIERALLQTPEISAAIVIPTSNLEFGVRPVAFIKLKEGVYLSAQTIIDKLKSKLPQFKIPDQFFQWPALQQTSEIKQNQKDFLAYYVSGKAKLL